MPPAAWRERRTTANQSARQGLQPGREGDRACNSTRELQTRIEQRSAGIARERLLRMSRQRVAMSRKCAQGQEIALWAGVVVTGKTTRAHDRSWASVLPSRHP